MSQLTKLLLHKQEDPIYDYDYMDNDSLSFSNRNEKSEPNFLDDDDERFLLVDELRLHANHLKHVNLQHMLQSVRNVKLLDLSHNPIESVIRLSGERSLLDTNRYITALTSYLCYYHYCFKKNNKKITGIVWK